MARLQVGGYALLKNFRRGLRHQLEHCASELEAATARADAAAEADCEDRLLWIGSKQQFLDVQHEMVTDTPSWRNEKEMEYGSLHPDARRPLTEQEIAWNEELIVAEAATARPRG